MTDLLEAGPTPPTPPSPAAAPGAAARPHRPGLVLAVVLIGQFMAILDVSIVNVAAPTIRADLDASGAALQLIVAGYTIAYAMLLITGARLGGRHGPGRTFLLGLALFTAASLACGLAWSSGALIAFRLLQGAGAAVMVPQVLNIVQLHFDGPARARALSTYAAVIAGGIVAGQVAGGVLVEADLFGAGWRPVFLVNVPLGVALLLAGRRLLPDRAHGRGRRGGNMSTPGGPGRRLDVPGLVLLSAAVVALVVPLVLGRELDWPVWGWALLAACPVLLAIFAGVERRIGRRGGTPLIPAEVVRAPTMLPAALAMFAAMATYGGFLFSMALHLQSGLGDGPREAGLRFVPAAVGFATGSLTWQRLPARWHGRLIPLGFGAAALAYAGLAPVLDGGGHGGVALPALFLVSGIGFGYAYSPILSLALRHVVPAHAPDASGLLVTVVQLGQVVGVATFGTLFLSRVDPGAHPATVDAITTTATGLTLAVALAAGLGAWLAAAARDR